MSLYYAVAYNWGKINSYQYMVKIGSLQECKQAAEAHQADRAGVFGVAIFSAEGKERSLVEYYSSKYGETEPVYDVSLANYQRIGSLALTLYRRGVVLPDELDGLCRHLESSRRVNAEAIRLNNLYSQMVWYGVDRIPGEWVNEQ